MKKRMTTTTTTTWEEVGVDEIVVEGEIVGGVDCYDGNQGEVHHHCHPLLTEIVDAAWRVGY